MSTELITKAESEEIRKQNSPIVAEANKLVINTAEGENKAFEALKVIKERLEFVENKRTVITKPLNKSLREVNTLFKELSGPLKTADDIIRKKILLFHEEQRVIAEKEEAKRHRIQEAHRKKGHKIHAPAVVEPERGNSTTQKRWVFEVKDIKLVPEEYLVVDTSVVNNAIANGTREIKGLRIFQRESITVR
ncbi:hypothetical protein LCGC14_1581980 [marine sediment metagenome]|uniref:Uncharacterized protein n=1 Tax=marine sediment metagenome TaxID=412755 RepID=A0A0F9IGT1_9ZZZZ